MLIRPVAVLTCVALAGCAPNEGPSVTLELVQPTTGGPFYTDIGISIVGSVADDKDEIAELDVALSSSIDGPLGWALTVEADGSVSGSGTLSAGEHTLSLDVTDSKDDTGSATAAITVRPPNTAPTCVFTSPQENETFDPDADVVLQADVDDVDIGGDALEISWSSDLDGALGTSTASGGVASFTASLTNGIHDLTVSGADELGLTCSDTVRVRVDRAPTISFVTPDPSAFLNDGELLRLEVQVGDEFDAAEELEVSIQSDLDGVLGTPTPDASGRASIELDSLSVGDHVITASALDSQFMTSEVTADVTVNGLPSAPDVHISPDPAFTLDDLAVEIRNPGVDPESDPVTYSYVWTVDGADAGNTTGSVSRDLTTKGQVWGVTVTSHDPYGTGGSTYEEIVLQNTPPVISSVALSPTTATASETLSCSVVSAADDDGDPITFTWGWSIDGVASSTTTSTLAGEFAKGESVSCQATPNDGEDVGAPVSSSSVAISNTPPTSPEIDLSPAGPVEGRDDLLCEITTESTDIDGDSITYAVRWELDGAAWTGSTSRTVIDDDTIDALDPAAGDEWQCFVTPDDGDDEGSEASSDVVTVLPDAVVYDIVRSDLINQGSTCGTVSYDSVYNNCSGDWGFRWTDTRSTTPAKVTVQLYHGIQCSTSTAKSTSLNGVGSGTFTLSGGNCACDPSKAVNTWVLTDIRGYAAGGSNTFNIGFDGSCEGLSVYTTWGAGVYARVTVEY